MLFFLFDYRNYAFSDGKLRNLVDPPCQLDDIRAAISHVRSLDVIDPSKIVLCGVSLAGGYPLSIAAEDKDIAAVICIIPVVYPKACLKMKGIRYALPYLVLTRYDHLRGKIGLKPFYLPMLISRSHLEDFLISNYYPGYTFDCSCMQEKKSIHHIVIKNNLTGQSVIWDNLVPFRSMKNILEYEAVSDLPKVTCPIMVIAGKNDSITPYSMLKPMLDPLPNVEFFSYDGNHFNVADKNISALTMPRILSFLAQSL